MTGHGAIIQSALLIERRRDHSPASSTSEVFDRSIELISASPFDQRPECDSAVAGVEKDQDVFHLEPGHIAQPAVESYPSSHGATRLVAIHWNDVSRLSGITFVKGPSCRMPVTREEQDEAVVGAELREIIHHETSNGVRGCRLVVERRHERLEPEPTERAQSSSCIAHRIAQALPLLVAVDADDGDHVSSAARAAAACFRDVDVAEHVTLSLVAASRDSRRGLRRARPPADAWPRPRDEQGAPAAHPSSGSRKPWTNVASAGSRRGCDRRQIRVHRSLDAVVRSPALRRAGARLTWRNFGLIASLDAWGGIAGPSTPRATLGYPPRHAASHRAASRPRRRT